MGSAWPRARLDGGDLAFDADWASEWSQSAQFWPRRITRELMSRSQCCVMTITSFFWHIPNFADEEWDWSIQMWNWRSILLPRWGLEEWLPNAHWRRRGKIVASLYHKIVISLYPSSRRRKGVWDKCNAKTKCKFIAAFSSLAQFEDLNAPPPSCENGIQGKSCQLSSREPRNNFSQVALSDELDPVLIGFQYYSSWFVQSPNF